MFTAFCDIYETPTYC